MAAIERAWSCGAWPNLPTLMLTTRDPFGESGLRTGVPAGSRPPLPDYRVRRRTAGFSALGSTFVTFIALAATGVAAPRADRSDAAGGASSGPVQQAVLGPETAVESRTPRVVWRNSRAVGQPTAGALVNATKLPAEGRHFFTWDAERRRSPSATPRRYATDRLIRVVLRVAADFARAHPTAPRLTIGDLSRPHGGSFGAGLHASHQNGLDADIYYPRRDRRERAPRTVSDVDLELAQDLVDRFVRAGGQYVFVGPKTKLTGPRGVVMVWPRHDNHLHVRLRAG